MRQYIPLGGIYECNFLLKPDQIVYPSIAVSMKTDKIPYALQVLTKMCPYGEKIDVESVASEIDEKKQKILKCYIIKIKIPTKYVKWAEPIPCQFILGQTIQAQQNEPNFDNIQIPYEPMLNIERKSQKSEEQNTKFIIKKTFVKSTKSNTTIRSLAKNSKLKISQQNQLLKDHAEVYESRTKWTTKYILKKKFNKENGEMKIWTDRLGVFAFMYPKYIHFPFRKWSITSMAPSEVILSVDSSLAKFTFKITERGYVILVTNHYERFIDRVSYLQILEPIPDIDSLKRIMLEQNLNIFSAVDTGFYLEGRFSQKMFALESHTYDCMAAYSTYIQFHRSEWNCIANYKNIILKCGENTMSKDKSLDLVQINTHEARYVSVEEVCTDLSEVVLDYKNAKEISYCADLFHLISLSLPGSYFSRVRNANLFLYVSEILKNIQPLSFS